MKIYDVCTCGGHQRGISFFHFEKQPLTRECSFFLGFSFTYSPDGPVAISHHGPIGKGSETSSEPHNSSSTIFSFTCYFYDENNLLVSFYWPEGSNFLLNATKSQWNVFGISRFCPKSGKIWQNFEEYSKTFGGPTQVHRNRKNPKPVRMALNVPKQSW